MRPALAHPARVIPLVFLVVLALGTMALMLPGARADGGAASFVVALFTAMSALCVTGLTVVDTATYWSGYGQVVLLLLFQVGGLGIMVGATLLGLLISRRLGLASRLLVQAETRSLGLADIVPVVRLVVAVTLVVELLLALVLSAHLHLHWHEPWREALWNGVFHAVSAFNNAGFSTYSDSLSRFALDPVVLVPIMLAVVIGGIGFPVLYELRRELRRPSRWSVHTKITLTGSLLLLLLGTFAFALFEWRNPATLGELDAGARWLGAGFHSVMTRSGGFNTVDVASMQGESLLVQYLLMFVGGGSAGTASGIKVGTFFLLGFVVLAEIRGEPDSTVFRRRICPQVQRQAMAVVLLGVGMVGLGALAVQSLTEAPLEFVLFEVVSAFANCGLSTGLSAELPPIGQAVLTGLMFVGRVGTVTLAAALALRGHRRVYRYPEERPIVG